VTGCTNGSSTAANSIEDEVHEVLAICEGDAVAALRIILIANAFLKAEIDRLSAAVSSGFARGKVRKARLPKEWGEKYGLTKCRLLRRPAMAVAYYVALPFIRTEDGIAPGEA